ncbi:neural cell adhesion molecule 1-like [Dermacentor andersoni]|uniref:neural cell adhesion molecule 1-like n=1 Tax=Dermacentor andersoni TaxID=34620 RepID=UPI002155960A|nr:hemicentin-1-like [Dermacentor andersoni]
MRPGRLMFAFPLLYVLATMGRLVVTAQDSKASHSRPTIVVNQGQQTELPCETRNPTFNSTQHALRVEWFHLGPHRRAQHSPSSSSGAASGSASSQPIYTVDFGAPKDSAGKLTTGTRANLLQVVRWARPEWQGRAYFHMVGYPFSLKVTGLRYEDTGEYVCVVTFRDGTGRNASVRLQVVVPPELPVIVDESGRSLHGTVGPYDEGSRLSLLCRVKGGKPSPVLTWKRNGNYFPTKALTSVAGDVKQSKLTLSSLQRSDLMATYTCVSSNNVSSPMEVSVTLELNLAPTSVQIRKSEAPISSGLTAEILCEVWGSRPPPEITWWKSSEQLNQTFVHVSQDGNLTTSVVAFSPQRSDNGQMLVCRAQNPRLRNSAREDQWELSVHYKPRVQLRLGHQMSFDNIRERTDVTFLCVIDANPPVEEVQWTFNGRELRPAPTAADMLGGKRPMRNNLVIRNVGTTHSGNYSCLGANSEGVGTSADVSIHVKHSPVCRSHQRVVYTAARAEEVDVSCEVEAHPAAVTFLWLFNSSLQSHQLDSVHWNGTQSTARYAAHSTDDYGTLLCWARNEVGRQEQPCVFLVVPQGTRIQLSDETLLTMLISAVTVLFLLPLCIIIALRLRNKRNDEEEGPQTPKSSNHQSQSQPQPQPHQHSSSKSGSGKGAHSNGKADDYWISRETTT